MKYTKPNIVTNLIQAPVDLYYMDYHIEDGKYVTTFEKIVALGTVTEPTNSKDGLPIEDGDFLTGFINSGDGGYDNVAYRCGEFVHLNDMQVRKLNRLNLINCTGYTTNDIDEIIEQFESEDE